MNDDGCGCRRQESGDGSGFLRGLLLAARGRVRHLGGRRHLVRHALELGRFHLIVAHATDRILGRVDVEIGHDQQFDVAFVLERTQPLALFVDEIGRYLDRNFGNDLGGPVFARLFTNETQDGERHRFDRADAADSLTARTNLVTRVAERGSQALPRHLEQTETRQPTDLDARTIHFHRFAQTIFDRALIARLFHVDEIDDDQAADVADPQLAGDFVGRLEIGVGGRGFDVAAARGARRVDVDRDQRFGVIDDDRTTRGQLHLVRVGRLDLAFDLVTGEERDVVGVHLQPATALGRHEALHVFGGDRVRVRLVDQHFADIIRKIVAQCARDRIALAIHEER